MGPSAGIAGTQAAFETLLDGDVAAKQYFLPRLIEQLLNYRRKNFVGEGESQPFGSAGPEKDYSPAHPFSSSTIATPPPTCSAGPGLDRGPVRVSASPNPAADGSTWSCRCRFLCHPFPLCFPHAAPPPPLPRCAPARGARVHPGRGGAAGG